MSVASPPFDCRVLCASVVGDAIRSSGIFDSVDPYCEAAGFLQAPAMIQDPDGISACLLGRIPEGMLLAFRGTLPLDIHDIDSLLDWMEDFDADPIDAPPLPGLVHQGFWEDLGRLWPLLLPELQRQKGGCGKLYLVGHSKGGALANLAAMRLWKEHGIEADSIYTFGAPRCGDAVFAAAYDGQFECFRYDYADDIVPHLPPRVLFLSLLSLLPEIGDVFLTLAHREYAAVGTLRFIDWEGKIVGDSPNLEFKRMLRLTELILERDWGAIARDHQITCGSGYFHSVCPSDICGARADAPSVTR
ncbi:Mbeg1-like protein [Verrucomicrobium sp. 3C]|uniref:lipase family protein n=1 Tax=Verrucomicrobium sp. 3C TaxID=1134055 RepID=UPI00036093AC|nr:lipase family protein [Verrucomicrobium sp. 3C]